MVVLPEGVAHAKVLLCGEAPGETEEKEGRPFIGQAGRVLDSILEEVGIRREECYITNVVQVRPPGNNFDHFYTKEKARKVPSPELLEAYERLKGEIASCSPNVIVPLGNEALKAITGLSGITKYRGSILVTNMGKCVPSIHPASVARNWQYRPAVVSDFHRIKKESEFPEVRITPKELVIAYSTQEAMRWLDEIEKAKEFAFDIETESEQITCISFSHKENFGVSIPFWFAGSSLRSTTDELLIWRTISRVLATGNSIAHNGIYDREFLKQSLSIIVDKYTFDTMLGFHCLYLELPKALDFVSSIYTDVPYYKDDIDSEEMDVYFRYNATDSMVTYLCAIEERKELEERGLTEFYYTHMHRLVEPILDMQLRGVRWDREKRNELRKETRKEIDTLTTEFEGLAPGVNPSSPKQLSTLLYTTLGYPKQTTKDKATGAIRVTTNEEAISKLRALRPNRILDILLNIREKSKLLSTYLEVKLDEDNRIRCSYNITGTETGRLSSSATTRGTGTNLQNIPESVRELFIPDEGKIFLNADLSQAEARVVAYLSGDSRLIEVLKNGGDIHRKNAANIFRKKEEDVTNEERQLAKRVIHASNYGMGPVTFSRNAGVTVPEAKRLLNQYFVTYPRIKVWHMQVQNALKQSRRLRAPSGRERIFFNRFDDSLVKEGLAYIPQETVGTIVNDALIELWEDKSHGIELLLQVHDSILCQCPDNPDSVTSAVSRLVRALTRPITINGRVLIIPTDVKIGHDWLHMKKYDGVSQEEILKSTTVTGMGC